jgi:TPR repeat protein
MKVSFTIGSGLKYLGVAAVGIFLGTSLAFAGPEEDNALAEKEFARGDLVVSMGLWRKAAQAGYAPSQVWLGDLLDKAEEDVLAVEWYKKAADQGNAGGEYGLGQMYLKGEGIKQDLTQARQYIEKAATKNHVEAVKWMMSSYRQGSSGTPVDKAKADEWEAKLMAILPGYTKPVPPGTAKGTKGVVQ